MVRGIVMKGGVWKNTEDEILKVAVQKYGKNQWARISSLLVRKSPKQCKARWMDWLDPSIKKTEWTRDEEEKLLHLAKIMPTQWRTIAPIVGRTASQCLEHYEKLLDAAQDKDAKDDASDPRKLRPGEIDPNPEARPARPDAVDMDEDEKEMLSEARARLANTKGKKAKRKAREKQLDGAKRLAMLQKKRELKAAGINMGRRRFKRKHGIDYNLEIPLEHQVPKGFFDTNEDRTRTREVRNDPKFLNVNISELDGERRDAIEERERKKDLKRQKLHKEISLAEHLARVNKLNDPQAVQHRGKMILPAPQITEADLEEIQKLGGLDAVAALSGVGGATPTPMRTPRTPLRHNTLMTEAQNLIALTNAQTPLKGGESTPLHPSDFTGINPARSDVATPNVLATPLRGAGAGGATPLRRAAGSATPVRDELGLNADVSMSDGDSKRERKRQQRALKEKLRKGLDLLPEPSHSYSMVMPTVSQDDDVDLVMEEDAEDVEARGRALKEAEEAMRERMRSEAVRRSLPQPTVVNSSLDAWKPAVDTASAHDMILKEMLLLQKHDLAKYPMLTDNKRKQKGIPQLQEFTEPEIIAAREMLKAELQRVREERNAPDRFEDDVEAKMLEDSVYLPSIQSYGSFSAADKASQLQALQQEFSLVSQQYAKDLRGSKKMENKLDVLLGGFQKRVAVAENSLTAVYDALSNAHTELLAYRMLLAQEEVAIPVRIRKLRDEVQHIKSEESKIQAEYKRLFEEREHLVELLK